MKRSTALAENMSTIFLILARFLHQVDFDPVLGADLG